MPSTRRCHMATTFLALSRTERSPAGPEAIRNDDVQRLADRFHGQIPKDALAHRVPEADHSIPVDGEKPVGRVFHKALMKSPQCPRSPPFTAQWRNGLPLRRTPPRLRN